MLFSACCVLGTGLSRAGYSDDHLCGQACVCGRHMTPCLVHCRFGGAGKANVADARLRKYMERQKHHTAIGHQVGAVKRN